MPCEPMILATFQPAKPTSRNRGYRTFQAFEKALGYYPKFCFAARTAEEFRFNCWTSTPGLPEKLVLFEADDYVAYDAIEWCRLFANEPKAASKLAGDDIAHIFEDVRSPYAEFAVPSIPEESIISEVNLAELIVDILPNAEDETVRRAGQLAWEEFELMTTIGGPPRRSAGKLRRKARAQMAKTVFEARLSGIAYCGAMGEGIPIESLLPFAKTAVFKEFPDDVRYLIPAADLRRKIYDTKTGGTHEDFDRMMKLMADYQEKKFTEALAKIMKAERSNLCPCGSGRKYKKCHGRPGATALKLYEPFCQQGIER